MRIVYLGTPAFAATILKVLHASEFAPIGVVSQQAKPVGRSQKPVPTATEAMAHTLGLPFFAAESVNTDESLAKLQAWNPDLLVVAAFGQLLKEPLLKLPPLGCLNVHGSLLPKYRGAAPLQRALQDGLSETGITIQRMVRRLDAGDILHQVRFAITPTDTSLSLMDKAAEYGARALLEALAKLHAGAAVFTPQIEADATHAAKLTKEEAVIDWSLPAAKIACWVRAAIPWPVAETKLGGIRLKVFGAAKTPAWGATSPGEISTDSKTYLHVSCGKQDAVSLTEVQLENKKRLSVKEFLSGYRGSFPFQRIG